MPYVYIIAGLALLYFGAGRIVNTGTKLALLLGVKPMFIALTIVAFGTSVPELLVSVDSAIKGSGDLAVGNVVGSNICNIALILGLSAVIHPVRVSRQLFRFEIPLAIFAALLTWLFLNDKVIALWEALTFLALFAGYVAISIVTAKRGSENLAADTKAAGGSCVKDVESGKSAKRDSPVKLVVFIIIDLAILILGADLLVRGAVALAQSWGVNEAVIGLTIVAVGTSTPELAMTIIAALRKHCDFAIGNIVGSSIFNTLCILGAAGTIRPITAGSIMPRDTLLMLAVTVSLLIALLTKRVIPRWAGAALFLTYATYIVVLCKEAVAGKS
ncbi:MAG: calcium/sodium antiporter [Chitinispirillales bacterium]|jgi:cation:H+ antiporter|nr:calcium/sodium antiporter [Chitinispirillales bacterium]